jgi:hypothetical protein
LVAVGVSGAALAAPEPSAVVARAAPKAEQMVVFRSGRAPVSRVRARATRAKVGGDRCRVAARTPLAVLIRSRPGRLRLRDDFGSCPSSAAGVYVVAIGPDGEGRLGGGGWVYKVGRKAATAGAGDPTGPLGRGALRPGQRVLWFYCRRAGDCQRTLRVRASVGQAGEVTVTVTGYDDNGRGVRVEGAAVTLGPLELHTGAEGTASATLPAGRHAIVARKDGMVRSFRERVRVG